MKIRLKKLFGFRSGTPWKSGVAIVYYFVCISFFVIAMITPPLIPAQRWDTAVVKMSSIVLCAWMLTPAVFLSETKMRMKLPFFKDHLGLRSLVGLMITSVLFLYLFMMMEGCRVVSVRPPSTSGPGTVVLMEVTGYDNGPTSCGWERDWLGRPVYSYGPMKGKRKQVGITASGTRAKHGTVAADTRHYPFGTILYIPGYGYGRVEDRGGDIKGPARLDLWFPNEKAALQWGRRKNVRVTVWKKP